MSQQAVDEFRTILNDLTERQGTLLKSTTDVNDPRLDKLDVLWAAMTFEERRDLGKEFMVMIAEAGK